MRVAILAAAVSLLAGCVTTGGQAPPSFLKDRSSHSVGTISYNNERLPLIAHIKFPAGEGPFAAVVYAGGCNGWDAIGTTYMLEHMSWLEGRGYAVIMLDSLGSRKVTDTCSFAFHSGNYIYPRNLADDARMAFEWLAKHPKIKPDRIGLFGFSAGGGGAVIVAGMSPTTYRAIFAIYGFCTANSLPMTHNFQYVAGLEDNEVVPEVCGEYVKGDHELVVHLYPGVHHGYMLPQLIQGASVQRGNGRPVYLKYDPDARADTIERLQKWMDRHLLN